MKLIKKERHTVIVRKTIDISEEALIEEFGSVEAAQSAYADETDQWNDFLFEAEDEFFVDSDEDWISDRKGYTEVEYTTDDADS